MAFKHAYLILAHGDYKLLQLLVSALDDVRNDIFVHVDAKAPEMPVLRACAAGLYLLPERVKVYWGDVSVIKAEYALFRAAAAQDHYAYYHLLSGADLPLKTQDQIHAFFTAHAGKEFIGYYRPDISAELERKVCRWHLFPRHFRSHSWVYRLPRALWLRVQESLGMSRNTDVDWKKGTQWVSITDGLVRYLLQHEHWVIDRLHHCFCPDEIFVQTLCWQSPFRERIYCLEDEAAGCLRAIHWENGELLDWKETDEDFLRKSPAVFARKFNLKDETFLLRLLSR